MDSDTTLSEFYHFLEKERGCSYHTIKAYQNDLSRFISFLPSNISGFDQVNRQAIRGFLASEFDNGLTGKTVARRLASIKSFYKYLVKSEHVSNNPAIHVKTPKVSKSLPNFVDQKVIERLMESPDDSTPMGLRDRGILELFYSTHYTHGSPQAQYKDECVIISNLWLRATDWDPIFYAILLQHI